MGVISPASKVIRAEIRDYLTDGKRLLQILWGDDEFWYCDDALYAADDLRSPLIKLKRQDVTTKEWRLISRSSPT